jgi:ABC-2 type transport system ATP-binding protein
VHAPVESAADLNRLAAWAGITLRGLRTYRPSLEETFLQATGTTDGDITALGVPQPHGILPSHGEPVASAPGHPTRGARRDCRVPG